MALRLVQVDVDPRLSEEALGLLDRVGAAERWCVDGGSYGSVVSAVIGSDRTGAAVDLIYSELSARTSIRALVLPLDAVIPRPSASLESGERQERRSFAAVSREEVYAAVAGNAQLDSTFVAMTVLATIVAAIGLSSDNTAAVIGAMVVAPLLGPNMALALGLTLDDRALIQRAAKSAVAGILVCFGVAMVLSFLVDVDPAVSELSSRTGPRVADIVLAVAAGMAGTLAYTTGAPTYLVGVMVAVALLPPTVASGLFLAHGHFAQAGGAALLTAINATAVVLSSMLTFLASGMRPRIWWQEAQARRTATRAALALMGLLGVLGGLIYLSRGWGAGG